MSLKNLDSIIRRFLINEDNNSPDIHSHVLVVSEIIEKLKPSSLRETRLISAAKQHIYEIKRCARKLQEKVTMLEEQIRILEEGKE
jgi:hypothetical protein